MKLNDDNEIDMEYEMLAVLNNEIQKNRQKRNVA